MKKILIASKDELTGEIYANIFKEKGFEALNARFTEQALLLARQENPDIILSDIHLRDMDGFELLRRIKSDPSTNRIPVVILSKVEKEEDKNKAIELEARDFINSSKISPRDTVLRIRTILGEEKIYKIPIRIGKKSESLIELNKDLGHKGGFNCPKCGSPLELYLMRDLGKGEDYFKVSFVCPKCL
ncbi:response regulator [Candidatus Parcubacteria bacterium]|nr:response regulator [Candidatus Parcubacteria bacterium]